MQFFFGAGHAYVAEAALFFKLRIRGHRALMREQTFLHAHHEYHRIFQPFHRMHGHHGDHIRSVVIGIDVRYQRHVLQESDQCFIVGVFVEVGGDGHKFLHVLDAGERFLRVFFFKAFDVAGAADDFAHSWRDAIFIRHLSEVFDEFDELA